MAGGFWDTQNKVLPGVYIKYQTKPQLLASVGERGVVALAHEMDWGKEGEMIELNSPDEALVKLGHDIGTPEMDWLRLLYLGTDLTKGASKILIWRLQKTDEVKATATFGAFNFEAKDAGTRGNDLTVIIAPDPDSNFEDAEGNTKYSIYTIETLLGTESVDIQTFGSLDVQEVPKCSLFVGNDWLVNNVETDGDMLVNAGVKLNGGANGEVTPAAHTAFLNALETYEFNIVIYNGTDNVLKGTYASFVERMSFERGKYCQAVILDYVIANNETVISCNTGVEMADGTIYDAAKMCYWVAGVEGGCPFNQSLTYHVMPGSFKAIPERSPTQLKDDLLKGQLLLFKENNTVKVLSDVNTFTSFTPTKGKPVRKNRVIRTIYNICNDLQKVYNDYYIGKVDNNNDGLLLLKKEAIGYLNTIQSQNGIKNFTKDDITVNFGEEGDAVLMELYLQTVDSVEKIYIRILFS